MRACLAAFFSFGVEAACFFIYRTKLVNEAAAFVCIINLSSITYTLSLSLEVICRTRLNLLIARGQTRIAKAFFKCYLVAVLMYGCIYSALLWLLTPSLQKMLANSAPDLALSFNSFMRLYYLQAVFEVATMTVAVSLKSLRRVHILIIFNFCVVVALNLLAGFWISKVNRMNPWYNVLVMVAVNYFMSTLLVSLILFIDWEKAVAGERNPASIEKATKNEADTIPIHEREDIKDTKA